MFNRLKNFLQEARQEFKRINWPTKQEAFRYTVFVILFSLGVAIFLGFLDFVFLFLLNKFFL